MNDALDKFLKLKPAIKVAITIALMGAIAGGYYTMFYGELDQQIQGARGHLEQLKTEKVSYEKRKTEYIAYRNELNELLEEQRELLKALPKKSEYPTLIQNIEEQAKLAGLDVLNLAIDPEVPQDLYVKLPLRLDVRGTFHQITRFFKNLSELRRIVNVENLGMTPERMANDKGPTKLRARFIAATFRYIEAEGAAAAGAPGAKP